MLPIWPHGFTYLSDEDRIKVVDDEGEVVAEEGSSVSMGGGMAGQSRDSRLPPQLRAEVKGCEGPYWIVGQTD